MFPNNEGEGENEEPSNFWKGYIDEFRWSHMARYTDKGILDSDYPRPNTEFGIQTEASTYGKWDTQVTANTTYQRYNYKHNDGFYSEKLDASNPTEFPNNPANNHQGLKPL